MPNCYALGCNHISRRENCSFFRFPADPKLFEEWKSLCPRENKEPTNEDRLCSCHFIDGEKVNLPTVFAHSDIRFEFSPSPEPKEVTAVDEQDPNAVDNVNQWECRACLQKVYSDTSLIDLFQAWSTPWEGMENTIAADLAKIGNIELSSSDKHSKFICNICYTKLHDACNFAAVVQQSDKVLRLRFQHEDLDPGSATVWPKPIQLDQNINGNIFDNTMDIEIKQEVLSDNDCETMHSNPESQYKDIASCVEIKVEPEEMMKPQSLQINGTFSYKDATEHSMLPNGNEMLVEFLDAPLKEEPNSEVDSDSMGNDLPLECLLCAKSFHSVSGLKINSKTCLLNADIQYYLTIPSDSEDDHESSGADSGNDIEALRSYPMRTNVVYEVEESSDLEKTCLPSRNDTLPNSSSNPKSSVNVVNEKMKELPAYFPPNVVIPQPSTIGYGNKYRRDQSKTSSPSKSLKRNTVTKINLPPVSKKNKRHIIWEQRPFVAPRFCEFTGNDQLTFTEMNTPLQFFLYFFDDDLLSHIVKESHKYSIQKDMSKPFNITKFELKKYLGICMLMGLIPLPNTRMYWGTELGLSLIMRTMTVNQFEQICQYLHFNDNSVQPPSGSAGHDRLHKIRPIVETLRKKCLEVPKRETLSVDEHTCATKDSKRLRQYFPNKPNKLGYKLLVLCDDKGFTYDFDICSGVENEYESDLDANANIILRLATSIPRGQNYKLFFDSHYTCPELISRLAKEGIHSLGTADNDRLGKDLPSPSIKDINTQQIIKEHSEQWTADVDGTEVVTVIWHDRPTVLLSSFTGQQPVKKIRRYCKKQKKYIEVYCPQIVQNYKKHMGGVDLLNTYLGKHKIAMGTRKWYLRLFYHLIDVMVINSWLLYKRMGEQSQIPTPQNLREFKLDVAKSLCMCGPQMNTEMGRARYSHSEHLIIAKRQKPNVGVLPTLDVRMDGMRHLPVWNIKRQRCKYPGCRGKTFVSCDKCKVELCLNKSNNCFTKSHRIFNN